METGSRESAQDRGASRVPPGFHIEFFANPAQVLWLVTDDWQHSTEEEKIAGLQSFHVTAEGRRGNRQIDAKLCNPMFGARP